jgi:hypothetical protein
VAANSKTKPNPAAQAAAQEAFNQLNKPTGAASTAAPVAAAGRKKAKPIKQRLVIKNEMPAGTLQRTVSAVISSEYQPWGPDNRYPDMMLEAIAGSGTAAVCTHTKAKFIKADGFADLNFYPAVINRRGLKVDNLLALHASDLANLSGCLVVLNFNAFGHVCEVLETPFAQWRPGKADPDGVVRRAWILANTKALLKTNGLKQTKAKVYNLYQPQETPADRIARIQSLPGGLEQYPGEVHLYFHKTTGAYNHPRPLHDAVLRDMISEAALKVSRGTDIRNGFSAQTMITEYGTTNPSITKLAADATKYGEVVGEDGVRLIVQYAQDKTTKPDVDSFKTYDAGARYKSDEESVKGNIRNIFLIPTILFGEAITGSLGGDQELDNAAVYVQTFVVNEDQRALEIFYREIFHSFWPMGQAAPGFPIIPEKDGQPSPGITRDINFSIKQLRFVKVPQDDAEPSEGDKILARLSSLDALVANQFIAALPQAEMLKLLGYSPESITAMLAKPTTVPTTETAPVPDATPAA